MAKAGSITRGWQKTLAEEVSLVIDEKTEDIEIALSFFGK